MSSLAKDIDNDFMKSYSMLDFDSFINADDKAESDSNRPVFVKDDVDVVAVFADGKAQSLKLSSDDNEDAEEIKIDTIWIYYSDNTFEQYAEYADGYEIFSTGTYSFKGDGDFDINEDEKDIFVINRDKKVISRETGLADYESSHEYELGTMGFLQLYGPGDNDNNLFLETADAKELETITYDIKSLGLTCFYVKSDPDIKKPEKIKQK